MTTPGPSPLLASAQRRWMADVQLWRPVEFSDDAGGVTRTWQNLTTVQCALGLASATERQIAAQEGVELTHTGKAPSGTDVCRGDRLVTATGQVIEIVHVRLAPVTAVLELEGRETPWDDPIS